MSTTIKITTWMRAACLSLSEGKRTWLGLDRWRFLESAGLVVQNENGTYELTEAGKVAAAEQRKKLDSRNRNARARSQAIRDLGYVKTPYGWE